MGKPLMIQEKDDKRILHLKEQIGAKTKIEVVRLALDLLEKEAERERRVAQWERAARLASESSYEVLQEFKPHSRIKRHD